MSFAEGFHVLRQHGGEAAVQGRLGERGLCGVRRAVDNVSVGFAFGGKICLIFWF